MSWNIAAECTSALYLIAILFYAKNRISNDSLINGAFKAACYVTLSAIVFNIISTVMIYNFTVLPIWLVTVFNTVYFVLMPVLPLIYFFYSVIVIMYSRNIDSFNRKWLFAAIPYLVYILLLILNFFKEGVVFHIDTVDGYVQGNHIYSTYLVFYLYCFSIIALVILNYKRVERKTAAVLGFFPLISLAIIGLQKVFPDLILTGTAAVFSILVLFLYVQNNRLTLDELTGLPNISAFRAELARSVGAGSGADYIFVSLKDFKTINNRYGAEAGNILLSMVGKFLQSLPQTQKCFRFSGDVFALTLKRKEDTEAVISAVKTRFNATWEVESVHCVVYPYIVVLREEEAGNTYREYRNAIEYSLALVKRPEHNMLLYYSRDYYKQVKRRDDIAEILKKAIGENLFEVYYQPIYSLKKRRFTQAEALLRLRETPFGKIHPDEFIPIAEEKGYIIDITYFVVDATCRMIKELDDLLGKDTFDFISVNFPFAQFKQPDLEKRLIEIFERNGVSPSRIKIEVTERALIEEDDVVNDFITCMSGEGVQFSLDDFGTGYSNIETILALPLDNIKVDKSLVYKACENTEKTAFMKYLIGAFKSIGKGTVAEGVETEAQMKVVAECGFDAIQGYFYARPMPEKRLIEFLKQ